MISLSFGGKTWISQNVIKGKMVTVQVPEGTSAAAVNIRIDLCGGTEVTYRDGMDGTHDIEWQYYPAASGMEGRWSLLNFRGLG